MVNVWAREGQDILVSEPAEMAHAPLQCHTGRMRRSAVLREHVIIFKYFDHLWQKIILQHFQCKLLN